MSQQRLQQHAYEQAHLRALTNDIVAQLANDYLTDVDALHLAQSCVLFFLTLRHRYETSSGAAWRVWTPEPVCLVWGVAASE